MLVIPREDAWGSTLSPMESDWGLLEDHFLRKGPYGGSHVGWVRLRQTDFWIPRPSKLSRAGFNGVELLVLVVSCLNFIASKWVGFRFLVVSFSHNLNGYRQKLSFLFKTKPKATQSNCPNWSNVGIYYVNGLCGLFLAVQILSWSTKQKDWVRTVRRTKVTQRRWGVPVWFPWVLRAI